MPRGPIGAWIAVGEGAGRQRSSRARICYPSCAVTRLNRKRTRKFDRILILQFMCWQPSGPSGAGQPRLTSTVMTRHARLANKNEIKKFTLPRADHSDVYSIRTRQFTSGKWKAQFWHYLRNYLKRLGKTMQNTCQYMLISQLYFVHVLKHWSDIRDFSEVDLRQPSCDW
jgi:hypothetical protein